MRIQILNQAVTPELREWIQTQARAGCVQDDILKALGATVVEFDKRVKCCGSGIFLTEIENCAPLPKEIIEDANSVSDTVKSLSI